MDLIEGIKQEQQRVTKVREIYLSIGPPGAFAAAMMQADLDQVFDVVLGGDVVAMIRLYQKLKDWKE